MANYIFRIKPLLTFNLGGSNGVHGEDGFICDRNRISHIILGATDLGKVFVVYKGFQRIGQIKAF